MDLSQRHAVLLGILGVALVAAVDAAVGYEVSLVALQMLPVLLVTWYVSARWGMFILVLMTMIGVLSKFYVAPPPVNPFYRSLDLASDFIAIAILILVQARLRGLFRTVKRQARTDSLSGCLNRGGFHEQLQSEVLRQKRYGRVFSLLYLDLDNFKVVNDTRGHQAGDALLAAIGRTLCARLRSTDSAGRLGGDEFAVLLRETDQGAARHAAAQIKQELERTARGHNSPVGFSIGVVCFTRPPADADEALRATDEVMYEVKKGGKGAILSRVY